MKPPKELIRLIQESKITAGPEADDRILHDALKEMETRRRESRAPLDAVIWRTLMKKKIITFATASLIVIVALIVFQFVGNPVGPNLTFASIIEPILKAHTAAYDIVIGPDDGSTVIHELVMGSRIRKRVAGSKATLIHDLENQQMLGLDFANMEALPVNLKGLPLMPSYLEELKNTIQRYQGSPDFTVGDLGRKKLGGHEVVGFSASNPEVDITIWAKVDTGLPVRIEIIWGRQTHITMKNIEFDLPMEEGLFSMEIPAGFTVQESVTWDFQAGKEANFINGLRMMAERINDGFFPDSVSFDDVNKRVLDFGNQLGAMNLPRKEVAALEQQFWEYMLFTLRFPGEGEWTYRGKGVRLGETGTPIFWYRPKGSEDYRVIYGDLHAENIAPERLPH